LVHFCRHQYVEMILRSFASNQPYTLIAVPVTVLAALIPAAWGGGLVPLVADFPADDLFYWVYQSKAMVVGITATLIIAGAFYSNLVFNRHEFYNVPVFVPAIMYAMSATVLSLIQLSLPVLLANVFFLAGLNKQLLVFRQTRVLAEYFEAGFWYGMAAVFFPPYLALAAGLWITTIVTRAFHWREHVLPLIAFSAPFLYWVVWKYWNNEIGDLVLFHKTITYDVQGYFARFSWAENVFFIVSLLSILMSLPRYLFLADRASNKARSVKNVFLIMALAMSLAIFVGYVLVLKWILLCVALPLTFVAGYWFTNYRYSLVAPLAFYVFCAAATLVVLHFYGVIA
jgi:hypothetical protein